MDSDIEGRVRAFWEQAFNGRDLDLHLASDGDTVICIRTMSGTHEGMLLVPATRRKVEWSQCHLYRFDEDGRAVEHDAIRDDVRLLRQFDG